MYYYRFRPQRTLAQEPTLFHSLRVIVAFFIVLQWVTYVGFLLTQIFTDKPVIEIRYPFEEKIEAPDIELCGSNSELKFYSCVLTYYNNSKSVHEGCFRNDGTNYIVRGERPQGTTAYCHLFSGKHNVWFGNTTNSVRKIGIYYKILNISATEGSSMNIANIAIQLIDPNRNLIWDKSVKIRNQIDEVVYKDMKWQGNNFAGLANYSTVVNFKKQTYLSISPSDVKSYFGLRGVYDETVTIPSIVKYYPLNNNPEFKNQNYSGYIAINIETFFHEIHTEKRVRTVLNSFGVIGGAFGVAVGLYYFLFGDRKIHPWGIMHCLVKSGLKEFANYRNFPMVSPIEMENTPFLSSKYDSDRQFIHLETRIKYLEGLMGDYLIDIQPIKNNI
ncbi:6071_t:CDS:2 [Ambispora gerdemannii]|uniref:6071_t:CDS:1 n=1 Tax=Ambispora gerdemannii TaxID=144530 RepID=A0A9N9DUP3_9GLOM|nr:6071_t:CDS:2 [Ambispora gerdemannii]